MVTARGTQGLSQWLSGKETTCCSLLQTGTWGLESKKRERERAISLRLCGKPIKPIHKTCNAHKGTGHLETPSEKVSSVGFHAPKN